MDKIHRFHHTHFLRWRLIVGIVASEIYLFQGESSVLGKREENIRVVFVKETSKLESKSAQFGFTIRHSI